VYPTLDGLLARFLLSGFEPYIYDEQRGYYLQDSWSLTYMRNILSVNRAALPSTLVKRLEGAIKAKDGHALALEGFIDALAAQKECASTLPTALNASNV
jgi:hypothetical protein